MKLNRSLAISTKLQDFKSGDVLGALAQEFPRAILEKKFAGSEKTRNRVFTPCNTLLTMIISATQGDKTLKNAVNLYYKLHQHHRREVREHLSKQLSVQKAIDCHGARKVGRPKKYALNLPVSLEKDISLNTAAYAKARQRLPLELIKEFFKASRIKEAKNDYSHWNGYRVMITDGTYLQLQDTTDIKAHYAKQRTSKAEEDTYPQALLAGVVERGTGQLYSYRLSDRHVSELLLLHQMLDELPAKSIVLADDLYNCYEIMAKCKEKGVELVVPGKRIRNYRVVTQIGHGDEIVEVSAPMQRSKWLSKPTEVDKILLRRMVLCSPKGEEWILYSTLLDKSVSKDAFSNLYLTRWDIEISIREMKSIMDLGVIRAQSAEMVHKEILAGITGYNLIRKMIHASIKSLPFSPQEDIIFQFYTLNKAIFVDAFRQRIGKYSMHEKRAVNPY